MSRKVPLPIAWLGILAISWFLLQAFGQQGYAAVFDPVEKRLNIVKIEETIITEEVPLSYSRERRLSAQLGRAELNVLQQGEEGLARKTYLVRKENGVEKERRLLETVIVKEAIPEIWEIGTRDTIVHSSRSLPQPRQVIEVEATAYTHTGNNTFTGVYPHVGTVAVDPAVIPLGSKLWVEGYGYGIAQDTGGFIKGKRIDLFMDTEEECLRWGRRSVKVYLLE